MTLGDGMLWSTVLVLFAAALYQVSVRQKWRTVGKVFGIVVLTVVAGGGAAWGWSAYQNQPNVVEALAGVRLGMSPLEVRLALGAPTSERELSKPEAQWIYGGGDSTAQSVMVLFKGEQQSNRAASIVCVRGGLTRLLGLGRFNSEEDVMEALGQPTSDSVNASGLAKYISYEQWNVAYEIAKGQISQLCISNGGVMFREEYQEESMLAPVSAPPGHTPRNLEEALRMGGVLVSSHDEPSTSTQTLDEPLRMGWQLVEDPPSLPDQAPRTLD